MRKVLCVFILVLSICRPMCGAQHQHGIKTLILVVASDDYPIYIELQKFWRLYMHSNPDHIEVWFVKSNPQLSSKIQVIGDTIWCQEPDGFCHDNCGIIMKTLDAFEYFLPRIRKEFNYVMRTNLSTFCVFPRLLNYLKTLPSTRCYAGTDVGEVASGTGMIMSPDVVGLLMSRKDDILNHLPDHCLDDVTIGKFLLSYGIQFIPHNFRIGIYSPRDWECIKNVFPSSCFQVHIKTEDTRPPRPSRIASDSVIHEDLLKMFYSLNLSN